jgi:hypothetical protein
MRSEPLELVVTNSVGSAIFHGDASSHFAAAPTAADAA